MNFCETKSIVRAIDGQVFSDHNMQADPRFTANRPSARSE